MLVSTANLTESRIMLSLGDYLYCINWGEKTCLPWVVPFPRLHNWGGKTCLLWVAPFPRLHRWERKWSSNTHSLFSASSAWCFDLPAIIDCTMELKGEMNPFSIEFLLSGYFFFSHQQEKELRYSAWLYVNVCMCAGAYIHVGGCEHMWTCMLRPKDNLSVIP